MHANLGHADSLAEIDVEFDLHPHIALHAGSPVLVYAL
jgi:hypothetical protein